MIKIKVEVESNTLKIELLYFSRDKHTKYAVLNTKEKEDTYQYNFNSFEIILIYSERRRTI